MKKKSTDKNKKDAAQPGQTQNPASLPHGTTNDQINEMESEGQATKPGQDAASPSDGKPPRQSGK